MDAIGPIRPADGEFRFIAHVECPYSRFVWLQPLKEDSEEEWAAFLVESVFFDLAGFPAVLRSDRGTSFTGGVIKAVNTLLGITHAFGSSYHPESQGYIEARHKGINTTLAAYARDNPGQWARRCKLAQWAMRATPRGDRDGRSPFEIITGLKPQGPLQRIFQRMSRDTMAPSAYIRDLTAHLKSVHDSVRTYMSADFAQKKLKEEGKDTSNWLPQIGDIVLLKRPPPAVQAQQGHRVGEVSARLTPLADVRPLRVLKQVGPKAYILCNPDTSATDLGFQQPVSLSRLIPFDMAALETPTNAGEELWIDIKSNKVGRANDWLVRQIIGQLATGNVRLQSQDGSQTEIVDLASFEWRWRTPPRSRTTQRPGFAIAKYDPVFADRNSPYAHPAAGDTAGWRALLVRYLKRRSVTQVRRIDELLQKYHGREHEYYKELIYSHEGEGKGKVVNAELGQDTCRLCGKAGHWGNECPTRKTQSRCASCGEHGHTPMECTTIPPWKRLRVKQEELAMLTDAPQAGMASAVPAATSEQQQQTQLRQQKQQNQQKDCQEKRQGRPQQQQQQPQRQQQQQQRRDMGDTEIVRPSESSKAALRPVPRPSCSAKVLAQTRAAVPPSQQPQSARATLRPRVSLDTVDAVMAHPWRRYEQRNLPPPREVRWGSF